MCWQSVGVLRYGAEKSGSWPLIVRFQQKRPSF